MRYTCNLKRQLSTVSCTRRFCNQHKANSSSQGSLYGHLEAKIKATGPITVAEYMREVLTNPVSGYYMNKDVFGKCGDFTTSPEICQLFGEMVAIWFVNEWSNMSKPQPAQLIELGPGRGTLMEDILRVFQKLNVTEELTVHLVEVSDALSALQAGRLCVGNVSETTNANYYKYGVTKHGLKIYWYKSLYDINLEGYPLVVANEFFDALPVHKFQKTENGWREILIDIDPDAYSKGEHKFRYVISRNETPAVKVFVPENETRDHIEVSRDSILLMKHLATQFQKKGGIGLVIDYGHSGTKTDTFRAYRAHSQCDPLSEPGSADLTADVDFNILKKSVLDELITFGPITQRDFLSRMQIAVRLQVLLRNCKSKEQREMLLSGYKMLTDEDKMGTCFCFMCFFPKSLEQHYNTFPVYGFTPM